MTLPHVPDPSDAPLSTDLRIATAPGLSSRTLVAWRSTDSCSLPDVTIGAQARYRAQDIAIWLKSLVHLVTANVERGFL
jgi:hypothetical protein